LAAVAQAPLAAAVALAILSGSSAARADDGQTGSERDRRQLPLWELGVGAGGLRLPDYRGADRARTYVLPLPYFVYRGDWLRADREGARAVLLDAQRFEVDVSLAAAAPARNNPARQGMADLPARAEIGPNVNVELWRDGASPTHLDLRAPLRSAVTLERAPRSVGWTFNPHLNLDSRAAGWELALQAGAVFGDRRLHNHLYGVAATEATAQRPAYAARGGYAGWLALAGASRRFDTLWVGTFIRHDSLRGAVVADSPLVKSDRVLTYGLAVAWVFSVSDRLVDAPR
jgi:MipA family protein